MKIGLYIRVSTKNQKENTSLQTQRILGIEFCKLNSYEYEIFEDVESGGNFNRRGFDKLKEELINKNLDGIWVYDIDRISRDVSVGDEFRKFVSKNDFRFFVGFEEKKLEESGDRFEFNIRSVISDFERAKIKDRMDYGKNRLIENGGKLGNVGYGFRRDKNKKIVVKKVEAKLIKDIFKFYNYKVVKSYGEVFKRILRVYGANKIGESSIGRILNDKKYNGLYIGNLEGKEYRIELEKIIDDELWNKTQIKINDNKGIWRGNKKDFFLLKGKVICGDCKDKMWVKKADKYRYYECSSNMKNVKEKRKGGDLVFSCISNDNNFNKVNIDGLEKIIWDGLFEVLNNSEDVKREYKKRFDIGKGGKERFKSNIKFLEGKISVLEKKKVNDLTEFIGVLEKEEIINIKEKIDSEISEIQKELKELKEEENKKEYLDSIDGYVELMRNDLENEYKISRLKDKDKIIKKYIQSIEVVRLGRDYNVKLSMYLNDINNFENEDIKIEDKGKIYILKIKSSEFQYLIYKKFNFNLIITERDNNLTINII